MLNRAPMYRSEEARECGSEKLKARKVMKTLRSTILQSIGVGEVRKCGSEKLKARKARKVVNRYAQLDSNVSECL